MKKYIITMLFLLSLFNSRLSAQIGMMGNNPAKSAVLDLRVANANRGLLLPKVGLTSLTAKSPVRDAGGTDAGLMVYNTNAALAGGTGYYYWDNSKWIKLAAGQSGNSPDNLGNHTATMALDMQNNNVNNIAKLSTQTTSIAKGVNGTSATTGTMLAAGDTNGNANWAPLPQFARTFFWKGSNDASLGTYYSIAKPATSKPWTEFDGKTYVAPADGTLEVALVMYPGMYSEAQAGNDLYITDGGWSLAAIQNLQYTVGSILLRPMANNVAVPNSAVKVPFTVPWAQVHYYDIGLDHSNNQNLHNAFANGYRQTVYLTTTFPVTKGTTYSFKITVAGEAVQPGDTTDTAGGYNQLKFQPVTVAPGTSDVAWHTLMGVFYPAGIDSGIVVPVIND